MKDKHRKQMKMKKQPDAGMIALDWVNGVYKPWFESGAYRKWYEQNREAMEQLDDRDTDADTPKEALKFVEKVYRPWYAEFVGDVQAADDSGGNPGTPPPPPPGTPIKP